LRADSGRSVSRGRDGGGHDRLYGYGPIDRYSDKLASLGFIEGQPEIPAPHEHHYRAELDWLAKEVMAAFEWSHTPLCLEDEQ